MSHLYIYILYAQRICFQDYLLVCNKQIDEIVALVRGKLEMGTRITLGALIVIDVHGTMMVCLCLRKKDKKLITNNVLLLDNILHV